MGRTIPLSYVSLRCLIDFALKIPGFKIAARYPVERDYDQPGKNYLAQPHGIDTGSLREYCPNPASLNSFTAQT